MKLCDNCKAWWIDSGDQYCGNCGIGLHDFIIKLDKKEYWIEPGASAVVAASVQNIGASALSIDSIEVKNAPFAYMCDAQLPFPLQTSPETRQRTISIKFDTSGAFDALTSDAYQVVIALHSKRKDVTASFQLSIVPQIEMEQKSIFISGNRLEGTIAFNIRCGSPDVQEASSDERYFSIKKRSISRDGDILNVPFELDPRIFKDKPKSLNVKISLRGAGSKTFPLALTYPVKRIEFVGLTSIMKNIKPNAVDRERLLLKCIGNVSAQIRKYYVSPGAGFSIRGLTEGALLQPEDALEVHLDFDPLAYLREMNINLSEQVQLESTLCIDTDSEEFPSARLPIIITIKPLQVLPKFAGFDFGTSYSCIAIGDNELAVLDRVEVPSTEDNETRVIDKCVIPSAVFIGMDKQSKEPNNLFGDDALGRYHLEPWQIITAVKRLLGYKPRGSLQQGPYYINVAIDGQLYRFPPVQVASWLLKNLLERVEKYNDVRIENAVVAVPSRFSNNQVRALEEAFNRAGLKHMKIVDESLAAGINFIVDEMQNRDRLVLVIFDFGGGTIDITVLVVWKEMRGTLTVAKVDVRGVWGYRKFGGTNVTDRLRGYLNKKIQANIQIGQGEYSGVKSVPYDELPEDRIWRDERVRDNYYGLSRAAEITKIALSDKTKDTAEIRLHCRTANGCEEKTLTVEIGRDELEMLIEDELNNIAVEIRQLLMKLDIQLEQLDYIVLAGQSSNMPIVSRILKGHFGNDKIRAIKKEELKACVAKGAYWYENTKVSAVKKIDVEIKSDCRNRTATSFGIEALDQRGASYFAPIIEFGKPIPAKGEIKKEDINISEGQEMINISVYENLSLNNNAIKGNDDCEEIGYFWKNIDNLSINPREQDHRLWMELDENKKLRVVLKLGDDSEESFEFQASEEF